MGKILNSKFYITGKVKLSNSEIIDYDSTNNRQNQLIKNTFFTTSSDIFDFSNHKIGTISIYINDNKINEELSQIIKQTILHTLLVSILLILVLFLTLKYYILNPISNIINAIDNKDNKGIPKELIPNSNNKEINALSTSMNNMISSIKKSREILERDQYKLEYLLELSPIAVRIAKDRGEYVIFANHAYSKLHKNTQNIHGKNPKDYYVDKSIYEDIVQTLEKGEHIYNTLVELNIQNNTVWALASYMNIEYEGEKAFIGWFFDVTNEKKNEAKLFQALELQTTIFNNSGYLMISTDKNGLVKQFNEEAENLLGYKAEEVVDIHTPEIFHLKSEIIQRKNLFDKELNKDVTLGFDVFVIKANLGLKNEYEWTYVSKDKEHIPVLLSITALKDKENEIYGYLAIGQDISQRKVMESQAKLASMGEMIGNIAHQWRQPLSMISTIASGIVVKNEILNIEPEDIVADMDKIINQTNYLSKTIDDFRNFIKDNKNQERISIVATVEKALNISRPSIKNNSITLITNLKDDLPINGFENQLIQAFINIINNAKDALKTQASTVDKFIFVETHIINKELILTIKDSGGGISDSIIHKIFEPYFTTKHKSIGTGIGLSMSHQIITEHHDATIEVFNNTYEYNGKSYVGAYFQITFKETCLL
jgi:PAS domain S-box-containing protein